MHCLENTKKNNIKLMYFYNVHSVSCFNNYDCI